MENRPLSLVAVLIFAVGCLASPAQAGTSSGDASKPTPEQRADWAGRLAEAKGLQKQGVARRKAAKDAYEARKIACFKKFRVTDCQNDAKQEYVQATNEARRIENEGKAAERAVKKEELADKDARRLAQEPQRQADLEIREAETRAERERVESVRAAKLAEKEEKARVGEARNAAAEERRIRKQEKHEKKLAEKMEKASRHEAEADH